MRGRKLRARGQLFASGVLFGLMAAAVRLGTSGPGGFSGPQMTVARMAVGSAMVVAYFRLRPGTWAPVNVRLLVTRGLLGGGAVLLYFLALARIPAGEATLLNNTFPVLATVLSIFTLGERPTIHLGLALAVATLGMLLVVGEGHLPTSLGSGEAIGIASAFLGAGAVTSIRVLRATDNAFTIFFAFTVGGLVVAAPFAGGGWPADRAMWGLALVVGVVSFAAQLLQTHAYGALAVSEAAVWQQITPVASYLWAAAILGEGLSRAGMLGVALGLSGVVYGTVLGHRPAPGAEPDRDPVRSMVP